MKCFSLVLVIIASLSLLIGCTEEIRVSEKFEIPNPTVIVVHEPADQVPTVVVQTTPPANPPASSNDAGAPVPTPSVDAGPGRLEVELASTTPSPYMVMGGKDTLYPFTTYRVVNTGNVPMPIYMIGVAQPFSSNGFARDYASISWYINDCEGEIAGMPNSYRIDINVTQCHTMIDPGSFVTIGFMAKLQPVVPMSSAPFFDAAHSGHTPSLELDSILSNNGEIVFGTQPAPKMVLRKSQPVVFKQPLTTTLANTDQDLIKFTIKADDAGSIAWKQIMFHVYRSAGVELSSFRFRRGAIDMNPGTYNVTSVYGGTNLYSYQNLMSDDYIVVSFKEGMEEVVAGGFGTVYALHATVYGATSGSTVYTDYAAFDAANVVTSCIEGLHFENNPSMYNFCYNRQAGVYPPSFIWSDMSALPHSAAIGGQSGGSSDWTNGMLVQGLSSLSQKLTL